jgi:predicted membrane-bound dolichyl-phosphate-mannose-protein mannosyltransferase
MVWHQGVLQVLSANAEAIVTAGLRPELFEESGAHSFSRTLVIVTLVVLVLGGFAFRARSLSVEGLADDELNKLLAANDYRTNGLTAANGEHPFLMKATITASVIAAEKWNSLVGGPNSEFFIPVEAAVRLPNVIVGSLITLLLYLVIAELFGGEIALLAAALWAVDPIAIGFNRIAKEDTFLLFFFLLANVFWLRGQRVAESEPNRNFIRYAWAAAAAFGAMAASKYLPWYVSISISYYWIFQAVPETRWRLGRPRFLLFFIIMGIVFVILNPPIFLPETWHQIRNFASHKMMAHNSYEFMGKLYPHEVKSWFQGVPWYYYGVFLATKLPLLTLIFFLIGLPMLFRRKLGDGRYFLLFWMFFWLQFSISGSKFTRYTVFVLPAIYSTAAIAAYYLIRWVARKIAESAGNDKLRVYLKGALASVLVIFAGLASASAIPHYRLFTNVIGGGAANAGAHFPQDDFYDAEMSDALKQIALRAKPKAQVASESQNVCQYYAERHSRPDLICLSMSDEAAVKSLTEGDFIIDARGRHYFSNDALVTALRSGKPAFNILLGNIPAADVYAVDQALLDRIPK